MKAFLNPAALPVFAFSVGLAVDAFAAWPLQERIDALAAKWNRGRYDAFVAAHPTAKGTGPAKSWEKGTLCPSDPATADFFAQTIREIAEAPVAGVVVCLWDDYGLNCVCARCKANGLANNWGRQVAVAVKAWERAVSSLGKELIVRTWASGASHWLGDEWVHAPGYGGPSGEPLSVWGEAMKSAGPGVRFQTKVYNSDCQPAPPFSALLLGLPGTTADATPAGLRPLI